MKKRYIGIIGGAAVVALVIVLVVLNPLGLNSTAHNSTNGEPGPPPDDSNWIHPGKLYVENYVPGESVELSLQVHNGNPFAANFSVGYRIPDSLQEGYSRADEAVRDWVWISNKRPAIAAQTTYDVTLRLGMPSSANVTADKWEFWIGVRDQSQTGNIQIELCTRVLVTMASG